MNPKPEILFRPPDAQLVKEDCVTFNEKILSNFQFDGSFGDDFVSSCACKEEIIRMFNRLRNVIFFKFIMLEFKLLYFVLFLKSVQISCFFILKPNNHNPMLLIRIK